MVTGLDKRLKPWETKEGIAIWGGGKKDPKVGYFNWIRGSLRRALWSDYPIRSEWKKSQLRKVTAEERAAKTFHPSTKAVGACTYCNEWFAQSKLECDHIHSSDGCKSEEEAEKFLWYCAGGTGVDWCLSCVPCHKIKTFSERQGMSFEEACVTKKVIALEKDKKVMQWFAERDIVPESNAKKRRVQMVQILMEETYGKQ